MELQDVIQDLPIFYQTPKIEFYGNLEQKMLISYAKGLSNEDEYKINMQTCADICAKHQLKYILFESTNFKGTSPENQKWVGEYLIPHFKSIGIVAITLVMAKDVFGKFSFNNMVKGSDLAYKGELPFQFTDSFEDSYNWIMEQMQAF